MKLTYERLQEISASVGERTGWDFSSVRTKRAPVPWEYLDVVRKYITQADRVLDIGTGGGERFLQLALQFEEGMGVDIDSEMIAQARKNQTIRQITNVEWCVMSGGRLAFRAAEFDGVLNRHSRVYVAEIARVLRPGGYFMTQQVGRRNTGNVFAAFGWTPASFGADWWQPVTELASAFERLGCKVIAKAEYDVRYWFLDVPSLIFWLKAVPLPEPFDLQRHWEGVKRLVEAHGTARGIETNEHRELLIVRKA